MPNMATKELGEKYGRNKKSAQLINAAIRAELPGGNELLDALERAHKIAGRDERSAGMIGPVLSGLRAAKVAMEAEIRRRYDMPPRDESDEG